MSGQPAFRKGGSFVYLKTWDIEGSLTRPGAGDTATGGTPLAG
jgi:hypothetical protein